MSDREGLEKLANEFDGDGWFKARDIAKKIRALLAGGTEPVEEETADFAWNEVLDAFRRVWPGDDLIYSESPVELIYRLRDERDAEREASAEGPGLVQRLTDAHESREMVLGRGHREPCKTCALIVEARETPASAGTEGLREALKLAQKRFEFIGERTEDEIVLRFARTGAHDIDAALAALRGEEEEK